jgi:hypothetical protein
LELAAIANEIERCNQKVGKLIERQKRILLLLETYEDNGEKEAED